MRSPFAKLGRTGLLLLLPLAGCGGGGGGSGAGPILTTVTVVSASCPGGAGSIPNTTCQVLRVQTPGNAPIDVELRVSEPAPGTLVGTVMLLSGGNGDNFYANLPGGDVLIQDLLNQGFRVVDRMWYGGWIAPGPSFMEKAARLAELARWVRANVHGPGSFGVVSLSGGASEVAFGLAAHGLESELDFVVLTSGPGMARLDYLCLAPTAQWTAQCAALVPPGVMECGQPICTASNEQGCGILQFYSTPAELHAESILHPGADLDYPSTLVHILLGAQDCGSSVPQSLLYQSQLASPSVLQIVAGTPHALQSTAAGRAAILQALTGAVPATAPEGGPYVQYSLTVVAGEDAATVRVGNLPDDEP